jgi:hypothetical protein
MYVVIFEVGKLLPFVPKNLWDWFLLELDC